MDEHSRTRLSGQDWRRTTIDHVHVAFLRAECDVIRAAGQPVPAALVNEPDLLNARDNALRQQLLYTRRGAVFQRVPGDTKWFEVRYLEEHHVAELVVIGRCGWDAPGVDGNELQAIARRKPAPLKNAPSEWDPPILWGHSKAGPFTIIEGNHRLVAYAAAAPRPPLRVPLYIGLSPRSCFWHLSDPILA